MSKIKEPKTVLGLVLDWSKDRPTWIQLAVKEIIKNGLPDEDSIIDFSEICMASHSLCDEKDITPDAVQKIKSIPIANACTNLINISSVEGVNQLAPGQTLNFAPSGLSIVYGQNGSGKSGYARILKRACNARHRGKILPNAFSDNIGKTASATIVYKKGEDEQTLLWTDEDEPSTEISCVSIFDRDCAATHINQKNPILFRPFGLDIPDDLVTVCNKVKEILENKKQRSEQIRDPRFQNPIWSENSDIGMFLNSLESNTNLDDFPKHEKLNDSEISELARLQKDLASNPQEASKTYKNDADKIAKLGETIGRITQCLDEEAINEFLELKRSAITARDTAIAAAEKAFSNLDVQGVGESVWKELWDAARRYSESQKEPSNNFPPKEGDLCVLCHQPISSDAQNRMSDFENFVLADTEEQAKLLENKVENEKLRLNSHNITFRQFSRELTILDKNNPDAGKLVRRYLASLRVRRYQAMKSNTYENLQEMLPISTNPEPKLSELVESLKKYADNLIAEIDSEERKKIEIEFNKLNDRNQYDLLKEIATLEVKRLREIKALEACIKECSTTAVTKLGNSIADETITPAMRDRFHSEIVKLAADRVRVEIARTGGKAGSPQYEVKFLANKKAKVGDILSEGEQTCVALAAHLTDLTNEKSNSALIFDDPVTSLDHRWRKKVAERLVEEATQRQVIVFTHDLIFVNDLLDIAESAGQSTHIGSLKRTSEGCGVYSDYLPWRAAKIKQRVDKMEKDLKQAKQFYDSHDDENYRKLILYLYDELRSAWERGLEDRVFAGVIMRHRDYLNTKNLKRVAALDINDVAVFQENFKKCCDYVNSHDPSRGRDAEPPSPDEVSADIEALANWEASLRAKQNDIVETATRTAEPRISTIS